MDKLMFGECTSLYRQSGHQTTSSPAFTIIELLVVIVVIGILAAITIVSYIGITQRATVSSIQSDLTNASSQLKLYQTLYGSYPTAMIGNCPTAPIADNNYCLKASGSNSLSYQFNNSNLSPVFCLNSTNGSQSYMTVSQGSPTAGSCPLYNGLLFYLDAAVPASYSGAGSVWADLSGNNINGVINGLVYNSGNSGSLSFNGVSNLMDISSPKFDLAGTNFTISAWVYSRGYISQGSAYNVIIGRDDPFTTTAGYGLVFSSDNVARFSAGNQAVYSSVNILNGWHYIVGVHDTSTPRLIIYVDGGNQVINSTYANQLVSKPVAITNLGTDGSPSSSVRYFNGLISSVSIYNRALSQSEVSQNFNAFRGRYGI